jgi:DNA-binding transcriptional LysR family regulator
MKKIPIYLLQAFVTFSESKNIVEAARSLGFSQPGLSKQLKQLEAILPGKIFTLKGRKKGLTPFGHELYRKIKDQIGSIQEAAKEAWIMHVSPSQATIRILGRRGILDRLSWQLKFPGTLVFSESSNDAVIHSIKSQEAELGIVHTFPNSSELISKPLFKEEFQLVVPKKFFRRRPSLDSNLMRKLMELPCLSYRYEDELIDSLKEHYSIGSGTQVFRVTESYPSISEMAGAQMGWAVLPTYIPIIKNCWALHIPVNALPSRQFYLVYRPEFKSLDWFRDFVAETQQCFR